MRPSALIGRVVDDRYRIERRVGVGGMGEVYQARQLHIDRRVAIKVLRPERIGDEAAVAQFIEEARAVGRLTSPHTVTLHDAGRMEDGAPYLAMELLEGATLRRRLEEGPIPLEEAARILDGIALSLAEAHDRGLVHRDLKPANVFLADTPGHLAQVKVLDFGLARLVDAEASGRAAGTLLYMAPEALRGETVDARVDVYALGMVAYEMLAGGHPFVALDREALIEAQLSEMPPPLDEVVAEANELPAGLIDLVARSIGKPKRLRPRDASAFRAKLRAACDLPEEVPRARSASASSADASPLTLASETVVSRTLPRSSAAVPSASARDKWPYLAGVLALAAFGAVSVWGASDEEPAATDAPSASSGVPVASTAPVSSDAEAVELRVESVPEGAKVSIDGEPRGTTPITFELARGEPVVVEVVAAGRVPHRQTVRAERDQTLVLELASRPEATTRVPPPRARTLAPPHPVEPKPPPEPSMAERVHDYLE